MALHPNYPHIFTPLKLGPMEVPTRFFFAPHGSALTVGTKPADDLIAYSAERVRGGGCGMVVIPVVTQDRARTRQPSPFSPANVAAFRAYADAIHEAGGRAVGQTLYHWLGAGFWQVMGTPAPSLSPSVRQFAIAERAASTHAMGRDEIRAMVDSMRQTTRHMAEAGFDGMMLHASHATMAEQFLSPYYNERTDEYGGSLQNRMRFMLEMLEAAREGGGQKFAVGIRLNCDEQIEGGYGVDTAREVVRTICTGGYVDYVDLDVGMEPQQFHHGMPTNFSDRQFYRPWVEQVRSAAGSVPVLSVLGSITSLADAEAAIAAGVIDMAGAARQLIAEPEFVQNARAGREDRGRTCIQCNWCTAAGSEGVQGCTINPASYRERYWGLDSFTPAEKPSRVVVVGGGPGGLEAARVAALRGHAVILFEARERLGGALALWAALPGRGNYGTAIGWWAREMERLGVDLRLGAAATAEAVLAEAPDAVIVATGALCSPGGRSITRDADIPGHDLPHVIRTDELLLSGQRPTGRIVLLDGEGYHASSGTAEMLAAGGDVLYVTAGFTPLSQRVADAFEGRFVVQRMKQAGVRFAPTTWASRIEPGFITLHDVHTGEERREPADAVVLSTGRVPQDGLARELAGKVAQLFTIGDALAARMFAAATFEGHKFARLIGQPGAPATMAEAFFAPDPAETLPMPADMPRRHGG